MVENDVEPNDELEQNITVNEEVSIGEDVGEEASKQVEKKPSKEEKDATMETTYICPICKEYSSKKFGSVNAHARAKHGRNLILDNEGNLAIAPMGKKKKKAKEAKEDIEKPLTPYEEIEAADEFLRNFLTEFEFNDKFIDLLCRKVKRRNALPYPNELARDIRTMPSGITNPNSADYIADEYGYDFKNYLERLESTKGSHSSVGFDVRSRESHNTDYGGFPLSDRRIEPYRGMPLRDRDEDDSMMRGYRRANDERGRGRKETDDDQVLTMKDFMMWQVQEENRRLKAGNGGNPDAEQTWMRERMEKMEDALRQNDADRMQRLEDELKDARNTPPPQVQNGPSSEEVRQIVEHEMDARTKKLTADDVQRIVQNAMGEIRSVTKEEFVYREAHDKYLLEEKKLDESGRTRDVIGKAISDGFGHAGSIIGRMMTGEGETTGKSVEGYSNQPGNLMQVACPGCNAIITAPIGSSRVVCPGCGKRWDVEPQGYEQKTLPKDETSKDVPKVTSEPTTNAKKIAENIAIGEAAKKLEEELKKKKELEASLQQHEEENERKRESALKKVEEGLKKEKEVKPSIKKKKPYRPSKICPVCKKKLTSRRGVASHIAQKHPDYKRKDHDDKGPT